MAVARAPSQRLSPISEITTCLERLSLTSPTEQLTYAERARRYSLEYVTRESFLQVVRQRFRNFPAILEQGAKTPAEQTLRRYASSQLPLTCKQDASAMQTTADWLSRETSKLRAYLDSKKGTLAVYDQFTCLLPSISESQASTTIKALDLARPYASRPADFEKEYNYLTRAEEIVAVIRGIKTALLAAFRVQSKSIKLPKALIEFMSKALNHPITIQEKPTTSSGAVPAGQFSHVCLLQVNGDSYALKIYHEDPESLDHQRNEFDFMMRFALEKPPGLVPAVGFIDARFFKPSDKETIGIVMPYYPQGDLFEILKASRTMPLEEVTLRYFLDLTQGLLYLHENNICYADYKLENVLIGEDGHAHMCDFGFSHPFTKDKTCGTLGLLAPELLFRRYRHLSYAPVDIWALGAMLYEVVAGNILFNTHLHSSYKSQKGRIPDDILEQQLMASFSTTWVTNPKALEEFLTNRFAGNLYQQHVQTSDPNGIFKRIIEGCIKVTPSERYTAVQIHAILNRYSAIRGKKASEGQSPQLSADEITEVFNLSSS